MRINGTERMVLPIMIIEYLFGMKNEFAFMSAPSAIMFSQNFIRIRVYYSQSMSIE